MIFKKRATNELVFMSRGLSLIEYKILNFFIYIAHNFPEKDDYRVPIDVLRKYLNTGYSPSKFNNILCDFDSIQVKARPTENNEFNGKIFNAISLKNAVVVYSISKNFEFFLQGVYQPTNPFLLNMFSGKYACSVYSVCSYFSNTDFTPPIYLPAVLEYLGLEHSCFKRTKYFMYNIIKKATQEINQKSDLDVSYAWNGSKKLLTFKVSRKELHRFFDGYLNTQSWIRHCINNSVQPSKKTVLDSNRTTLDRQDFCELLKAFGVPSKKAQLLSKEYAFLSEEDLTKMLALFKTTPKNALFVHRWIRSII